MLCPKPHVATVFSVTSHLTEKCIHICPNIAQNGALVNKENCAIIVWAIFLRKNAPDAKKYRPNGKILPYLVTLTVFLFFLFW
jgi:hypothetical protein